VSRHSYTLRALSDQDLLTRLAELVRLETGGTADIVEHLAEIDRRDVTIDLGHPSLFAYCFNILGYSEAEAYLRIRAARASRIFPRLIDDIRSGKVRLDAVARLYPYLTAENSGELLSRAAGASKREVLTMVAELDPAPPPARDVIVPVPAPSPPDEPMATPQIIAPPQHRFHFTGDTELVNLIDKLRGLLRHKNPEGRIEFIFREAATALVEKIEKRRMTRPPRKPRISGKSRYIPKAVKSAVWRRDDGRCAFVSDDGRRCDSRDALEYDHITPWAVGGASDTAENIRLLCRPHNQRSAKRRFGPRRRAT
jgi:hypothetical protein